MGAAARYRSWHYKDLEYWTGLPQTSERGEFAASSLADVLDVYEVYKGGAYHTARSTDRRHRTAIMLAPVVTHRSRFGSPTSSRSANAIDQQSALPNPGQDSLLRAYQSFFRSLTPDCPWFRNSTPALSSALATAYTSRIGPGPTFSSLRRVWSEARDALSYLRWAAEQDRAAEVCKTLDARTREIADLHFARAAANGIDCTRVFLETARAIDARLAELGAR